MVIYNNNQTSGSSTKWWCFRNVLSKVALFEFTCSLSRSTPWEPKEKEKKEQRLDFDYFGIILIDAVDYIRSRL
jgi:hypothetical protein